MVKNIFKTIVLICVLSTISYGKIKDIVESQPQILFTHKKLLSIQQKRELINKFNRAVLLLEDKRYKEAIELFNQSAQLLKVASYLNIGIAYYKLKDEKKAYVYLKKLYDIKELKSQDKFIYFSTSYYLYKITKKESYIENIEKIASKAKRLTFEEKSLVIDTLILLKKYKKALKYLKTLDGNNALKQALLYIKLRNYSQARVYLKMAYDEASGDKEKNDILWFRTYRDLKANDLANLQEELLSIDKRRRFFESNKNLKLKLFFNKNKFTPKQYYDKVTKLDFETKLDFLYYFTPFIFEEYRSLDIDMKKSFVLKNRANLDELDTLIKYNADFLKVIKLDSIRRVQVLHDMIKVKYDTLSYEYYNLALSYAQIYDYNNAYKYFKKAYNLEHGNKLYAVMVLLTAKRLNKPILKSDKKILVDNILSKGGTYRFLAKYIYKVFVDPKIKLEKKYLGYKDKKSIFFRALYFLENVTKKGIRTSEPLLVEYFKDPLVYLLTLVARDKGESDYQYISRMQDTIPKIYNNLFINNSLVIADYYMKVLRALGLFYRTDFTIPNSLEPSYLRTKAIVDLYNDKPKSTIKIMNYLQKKYELNSVDSYYILIAAYLSSKQDNLAFALLSELEFIYKDSDAAFFAGVKLIQDLKVDSASEYFKHKLKGNFIDIKLINFDKYLEEL